MNIITTIKYFPGTFKALRPVSLLIKDALPFGMKECQYRWENIYVWFQFTFLKGIIPILWITPKYVPQLLTLIKKFTQSAICTRHIKIMMILLMENFHFK